MTLRGQAVVRDKVPAAGVHLPPAPAIVRTLDVVILGVLHKPADGVLGLSRDDPAGLENVGAGVRGEVEVVHVLVHGQGVSHLGPELQTMVHTKVSNHGEGLLVESLLALSHLRKTL